MDGQVALVTGGTRGAGLVGPGAVLGADPKHYGFTDLDGPQPEATRCFEDACFGEHKDARAEDYR